MIFFQNPEKINSYPFSIWAELLKTGVGFKERKSQAAFFHSYR